MLKKQLANGVDFIGDSDIKFDKEKEVTMW